MVDRTMKGLYPILSMPFTDDGMIDEEDLRREVDFCISKGSDGLGIAMASEITKNTITFQRGRFRHRARARFKALNLLKFIHTNRSNDTQRNTHK